MALEVAKGGAHNQRRAVLAEHAEALRQGCDGLAWHQIVDRVDALTDKHSGRQTELEDAGCLERVRQVPQGRTKAWLLRLTTVGRDYLAGRVEWTDIHHPGSRVERREGLEPKAAPALGGVHLDAKGRHMLDTCPCKPCSTDRANRTAWLAKRGRL
jgi:hypothetical protein